MIRIVALAVAALSVVGCNVLDHHDATPVAFRTVQEARELRVTEAGTRIFRGAAEWDAFWTTHYGLLPPAAAPPIDFGEKMLAAVFWGERTGCSNAADAVGSVTLRRQFLLVKLGRLPAEDCTAQVHPIQVVEIPHSGLPVVFDGHLPG